MIISHKYKFIFFHCRKNAGSSVSVSLYRYLGPFDIAIGCWVDALNNGIRPNKRMYWWAFKSLSWTKLLGYAQDQKKLINVSIRNTARKIMPGSGAAHATASQIKFKFPKEFKNYYKFCIVRNPYERVISDYYWRCKITSGDNPSFIEYLNALKNGDNLNGFVPKIPDNWDIYTINNSIALDKVCFYENLESDLKHVLCDQIGLNWDGWLPYAKTGQKTTNNSINNYGEKEKNLIKQIFFNEIETFNYKCYF